MDIIKIISENYEWIFSGIGVFLLALFIRNKFNNYQKVGNNSTAIQAGRDIKINSKSEKDGNK